MSLSANRCPILALATSWAVGVWTWRALGSSCYAKSIRLHEAKGSAGVDGTSTRLQVIHVVPGASLSLRPNFDSFQVGNSGTPVAVAVAVDYKVCVCVLNPIIKQIFTNLFCLFPHKFHQD